MKARQTGRASHVRPLHSRRSTGRPAWAAAVVQETVKLMTMERTGEPSAQSSPQRIPNRQLAALIAEAGFSNAGLARRVDQLGLEHGLDLRYDKTSVTRWLRGQQPRGTTPALIAEVFTRRLGRRLTAQDLGLDACAPVYAGLEFAVDALRGGGHRQRAVAQGLRQPRGAAEDRVHPGRSGRSQPGLADRAPRRAGGAGRRPRLRRSRGRRRSGPRRRAARAPRPSRRRGRA